MDVLHICGGQSDGGCLQRQHHPPAMGIHQLLRVDAFHCSLQPVLQEVVEGLHVLTYQVLKALQSGKNLEWLHPCSLL